MGSILRTCVVAPVINDLLERWLEEVDGTNDREELLKYQGWLFKDIVYTGPDAVPKLFEQLRDKRNPRILLTIWSILRGQLPVVTMPGIPSTFADEGSNVNAIGEWLRWGKAHRYLPG